jgi:hypothetical protein
MARFSAGGRSSAGSTTLPIASVYASATISPKVVEIGVSNTTATAVALKLCKLTTAGTQGTGLTETSWDEGAYTAACTAVNTHSSTGPTVVDLGMNITLGGVIGAGWIWTFGSEGIAVPAGTGNGVGIIVATGTGQVLDFYFVWDE